VSVLLAKKNKKDLPDVTSICYDPTNPSIKFFKNCNKISFTPVDIMKLLIFKFGYYTCVTLSDLIKYELVILFTL